MERRNFLKALLGVAGAAAAVTMIAPQAAEAAPLPTPEPMPATDQAAEANLIGKDDELPEADQTQYYVRRRYYRPRRVYVVRRRYYRPRRRVYVVRRRRPIYRVRRVYWY